MKENQRIRLSKTLLRNSLIVLLKQKSIHKISVTEICAHAQINRTTFYKHYGSQYDLLADIENEVLTSIASYVGPDDSTDGAMRQFAKIISYIDDNIDICRILFDNNIGPDFPAKLISLPRIRQSIAKFEQGRSKNILEYTFSFVVAGSFDLIRIWMNKEEREPPAVIARLFSDLINKLLPEA
ncbi:MAG: TetR/AcrR family transcriptional regulator [Gracilibacteraceae bacterium]|jgi:AcrR family transcriptional regulator|nr:TetR/AcrR family transcriptional regulator [Gracilibacteraceae bacterium]